MFNICKLVCKQSLKEIPKFDMLTDFIRLTHLQTINKPLLFQLLLINNFILK